MSAAIVAHHGWIPRRVPNYLNVDVVDRLEVEQSHLHAPSDAFVHRATLRRERHLDEYFPSIDGDAINQSQVDDVAIDLGINHLAQGLEDDLFV